MNLPLTPPCCGGTRQFPPGTPQLSERAAAAAYLGFPSITGDGRSERLSQCLQCQHLATDDVCCLCVQLVYVKTRYDGESCPIGRWDE